MNINEDTEFNDALRKHGILPPREALPTTPSPPPSPKLQNILEQASTSDLEKLEDETIDSETERVITAYRRQRVKEFQRAARTAKFGRVYPIGREDYTREVTDASKVDIAEVEIKGTGIVCILYKESQPASNRLLEQATILAKQYPSTKFTSIVGNKCIPNYSDSYCPTILVYRAGEVTRQTLSWGTDRKRSMAELEAFLILSLAIASPRSSSFRNSDSDLDCEEIEHPQKHYSKQPNRKTKDSDSDFDL